MKSVPLNDAGAVFRISSRLFSVTLSSSPVLVVPEGCCVARHVFNPDADPLQEHTRLPEIFSGFAPGHDPQSRIFQFKSDLSESFQGASITHLNS